jgi:hypothetical protein
LAVLRGWDVRWAELSSAFIWVLEHHRWVLISLFDVLFVYPCVR